MYSLKSGKKLLKKNRDNSYNLVDLDYQQVKSNRILSTDKFNYKELYLIDILFNTNGPTSKIYF